MGCRQDPNSSAAIIAEREFREIGETTDVAQLGEGDLASAVVQQRCKVLIDMIEFATDASITIAVIGQFR